MKTIGVSPALIAKIPYLEIFLEPWGRPIPLRHRAGRNVEIAAVAGWGRDNGRSTLRAQAEALRLGVPYLALASGFLPSLTNTHLPAAPWSLAVDEAGIYVTKAYPSRFLDLLGEAEPATKNTHQLLEKFRRLGSAIVSDSGRDLVVVVDQNRNDPALRQIETIDQRFEAMLESALAENPHSEVVVATDGEHRRGILHTAKTTWAARFDFRHSDLFSLLRQASRIYTVASTAGLDALLLDKPVICFDRAFYAGYGFTEDRMACGNRLPMPFPIFVRAFFERYLRYVDPVHRRSSDAITIANRLLAVHHQNDEARSPAFVHGVSRWKQPFVSPFIGVSRRTPHYVTVSPKTVQKCALSGGRMLTWAAREPEWLASAVEAAGLTLRRVEDGFIRSVGLGSNFTPALSLVIDDLGIYFDPSRESRLERILNTEDPSPELLDAARQLRAQMIEGRFSKYNMEVPTDRTIAAGASARIILVPGQVEDDASIRLGSPMIKINLDLLRTVRAAAADATILYKPHPDVESGNRPGAVSKRLVLQHADAVIAGWDAPSALDAAHEIHTMTSLLGFEGLMRSKHVVTYGLPFYAGLGLTEDRVPWPRARRPVDLDTLVAATYLLYPRYRDPSTNLSVTAFDVLRLIERMRLEGVRPYTKKGRFGRWAKLVLSRRRR